MATNPLSGTPSFDLRSALQAVALNPGATFRTLRETVPIMPDEVRPLGERFASEVIDKSHSVIIEVGDDFETVWQMGRTLHKQGKLRDALTYIGMAEEMMPEHPRVLARKCELLLDLHSEMPTAGYADGAYAVAMQVHNIEGSEFTKALLARARVIYAAAPPTYAGPESHA